MTLTEAAARLKRERDRKRELRLDPEWRERVNGRKRELRRTDPTWRARDIERRTTRRAVDPPTARTRLWRYGLVNLGDIYAAQGGRCAICRDPRPLDGPGCLHVDHDHDCCSGRRSCGRRVRGLLCDGCNRSLPTLVRLAEPHAMAYLGAPR